MAKISDLRLAYQVFMKAYPYRRVDLLPGALLKKPLREARIAAVTTAAYFRPDLDVLDVDLENCGRRDLRRARVNEPRGAKKRSEQYFRLRQMHASS